MSLHWRHRHPEPSAPPPRPTRADRVAAEMAADSLETIRCLAEEAAAAGTAEALAAGDAIYLASARDARQWIADIERGGLLIPVWIAERRATFSMMGWL